MPEPRRRFDREFKVEAVKLANRDDKSTSQVARDLGISENILCRWKRQLASDPSFAFPGKGHLKPADDELRKLKKQLLDVTEERDILKKALAIFSKHPDPYGDS
jgi:transposase